MSGGAHGRESKRYVLSYISTTSMLRVERVRYVWIYTHAIADAGTGHTLMYIQTRFILPLHALVLFLNTSSSSVTDL